MIKDKFCPECEHPFPATTEHWYKDVTTKDGLRYRCKLCEKAYQKQYRVTHLQQKRECERRYRQTLKGKETIRTTWKRYRNTLNGYLRHVYQALVARCTNPNHPNYKNYGLRGIENRFDSFDAFFKHVTTVLGIVDVRQIKGLQINRINNDGHYMEGNINFVTQKVNRSNQRPRKKTGPTGQRLNYDL